MTVDADSFYPDVKLERIAFGSCHSRGALSKRLSKTGATDNDPTIWDVITDTVRPQAFLWTGDAIYPFVKSKGDYRLDMMKDEYQQMLHNKTLGYEKFRRRQDVLIDGVWDDHDFGGNDRGHELEEKVQRRDAYLDFLGVSKDNARRKREGMYSSVQFGKDDNKVSVTFLDTRSHRDKYCIPSVGSNRFIPLGSVVACVTRWITAGFNLPYILPSWTGCTKNSAVLGEDQWAWLERQLKENDASVNIVVSSIQFLTTNPVVESWGHFPTERERLLKLLNNISGLVILSGDVHHAEISSTEQQKSNFPPNKGALVEVTSSGLTHACDEPFYGSLCKPILDTFPVHRLKGGNAKDSSAPSYFTSRNFGSIDIDWGSRSYQVNVHDDAGNIVLTSAFEMDDMAGISNDNIGDVAKVIDGHLWSSLGKIVPYYMAGLLCLFLFYTRSRSFGQKVNSIKSKGA